MRSDNPKLIEGRNKLLDQVLPAGGLCHHVCARSCPSGVPQGARHRHRGLRHAGVPPGALLVWAWHETTFLTGMVTGRSKQECPPDAKGAARFVAAWKAVCDHEIALLVTAVFLWFVLADAPNTFGLATFGLLWGMRISAKLLIFLGARHAISGLMPPGIVHLKTYFQHWTDNPLFPASAGDRGWVVCGPGGWSDECAQRVLRRRSHFARRVYGTGNHRTPNSRSAGLGHGALALGGSQGARDPRSNPPGHEFAPAGVGTKRGLETR
jgi:hypothetical protein